MLVPFLDPAHERIRREAILRRQAAFDVLGETTARSVRRGLIRLGLFLTRDRKPQSGVIKVG